MEIIYKSTDYTDTLTKKILLISDDINFINSMCLFNDTTYEISVFKEHNFLLLKNILNKIDLIVFDNKLMNLQKFTHACKIMQLEEFNIPVISIEEEISGDLEMYKNSNVCTMFLKSRNIEELFISIDLFLHYLQRNKIEESKEEFIFDISKERLYQNKKVIELTKIEKKLIKFLSKNMNNILNFRT
ncbi:MAG: hypothetical protein R2837_08185 [Aliarcobacter sp.]